ncbi:hypothetical protein P5673_010391 [Acropora cervicornis]|uniref:Uncharacterized protein n=1 Tax=Acropora cervicornis TaxID=6130 RepID=A0AAD9QR96_ACRCE|nr:hypothetical protein P5673_010391 [Acropora cervicornis]
MALKVGKQFLSMSLVMIALIFLSSAGKSAARPSNALTRGLFTVDRLPGIQVTLKQSDDQNEKKEMLLSDQKPELKEKPREPQEDGDGSTFHTNDDKLNASSSSRASRDNSKSCIASYEKVVTIGSKIIQPVTCKPGCQANAITVDLPGGGSKIIVIGCS